MNRELENLVEQYRRQSTLGRLLAHSWENLRFVVLDTESTGFDPRRDHLISIAGVGVIRREIDLSDSFDILMPVAYNTSSVMVHGITREASAAEGIPEDEAMARFLGFVRDAIVVGHHVGHDIAILSAASERHFGIPMFNDSVDTLDLALRLQKSGFLRLDENLDKFSLDAFCHYFNVVPHDRHTAAGDAFITAQIFIKLLHRAWQAGLHTLDELSERWEWEDA